jgi:hypothetical protein
MVRLVALPIQVQYRGRRERRTQTTRQRFASHPCHGHGQGQQALSRVSVAVNDSRLSKREKLVDEV